MFLKRSKTLDDDAGWRPYNIPNSTQTHAYYLGMGRMGVWSEGYLEFQSPLLDASVAIDTSPLSADVPALVFSIWLKSGRAGSPADVVVALWRLGHGSRSVPFTTDDTWRQIQVCYEDGWVAGDVARCELYAKNASWI